ncbi:MAG: hypothetical protein EBQ94_06985 [Flavobacteriales bacterium]|nr:hypothetical protein [Crocinitomicaceae bacterium]NBX80111.1 hypothetical protein [Flavobacteriales bacterium]
MKKLLPYLFLLVLVACKKKDTTWNTDWAAPVVSDTLKLTKLFNDTTLVANGSFINVDLTRTILNIGLKDILNIPDTTIKQTFHPTVNLNNVPPGYTFVNAIEEHTFDLSPVQLKKIHVANGTIKIKVYNPIGTKAFFNIQLPGVTKNGVVFQKNYTVDQGTVANPGFAEEILDISNYDIDLTGEQFLSFNKLQSRLTIKSDPNGPNISISTSNTFKFEALFSSLQIDYAKGYFGNEIIEDLSTFNVPYFNNISAGSLELPNTSMQIIIENGMKMSLKGRLTQAKNTNSAGNTVVLSASEINNDFFVSPAIGAWNSFQPSTQQLNFDENNSNIKNYLENLGSNQTIGYKLQLNPWGNTSGGNDEIFPFSKIKLKVKAQLPLALSTNGLTLKDTFDLNLEQDLSKTHVESGVISLNATNSFPLSCDAVLYLMDSTNVILHTVVANSQISSSLMGAIDNIDGLYKKKSKVDFILNEAALKDINKIKKVMVEASFNTPNPSNGINELQSIPLGAFLAVKLNVKLNTKIIL